MRGEVAHDVFAAIDALRRSRRRTPADGAREELDERITSLLRLVLAVAGFGIHLVDPTEHRSRRVLTAGVLVSFAMYAALLHVQVLRRSRRLPRSETPWVDLAWVTALIAVSTGTSSIFFPLYLFTILCAAFGQGFRAGMHLTIASVLSFSVVGGLTRPGGAEFELDRSLIRPLYLLVFGYLISHWGSHENLLRARLALLREISALSNPRFGVEQTVGRVLGTIRAFYDADACHLVVADASSAGTWIRTASRGSSDAGPRVSVPAPIAAALFPSPATSAFVCGWRWGFPYRLRPRCELVDLAGDEDRRVASGVDALATTLGARSFLSVPFRYDAVALGRIYVVSTRNHAFDTLDVELLVGVLDRVLPVVDNVRLVDRLATEAADDERHRIALNLHDSVIQPYIGLQLGIRATREALERGDAASARGFAAKLEQVAAAEVDTLRRYVHSLRAAAGRDSPRPILAASVQRFCERFAAATGIAVEVAVEAAPVSDRVAAEILQIVAEALSNVRRHTESSRATVRVSADGVCVRVRIENDDGMLDGGTAFSPWSIRERAEGLGGRLEVEHEAGRTAVQVEIPL